MFMRLKIIIVKKLLLEIHFADMEYRLITPTPHFWERNVKKEIKLFVISIKSIIDKR